MKLDREKLLGYVQHPSRYDGLDGLKHMADLIIDEAQQQIDAWIEAQSSPRLEGSEQPDDPNWSATLPTPGPKETKVIGRMMPVPKLTEKEIDLITKDKGFLDYQDLGDIAQALLQLVDKHLLPYIDLPEQPQD